MGRSSKEGIVFAKIVGINGSKWIIMRAGK